MSAALSVKKGAAKIMPKEDDDEKPAVIKGKLASIAVRVLMKVMYCGRLGRFDLLRAIGKLAKEVSKWTQL